MRWRDCYFVIRNAYLEILRLRLEGQFRRQIADCRRQISGHLTYCRDRRPRLSVPIIESHSEERSDEESNSFFEILRLRSE